LTRFIVPDEPGIFNRWLFIYPFVGATNWTHSLNLADAPDAGYQGGQGVGVGPHAPTGKFDRFSITWSAEVTHNTNGVTMNNGSGNLNVDVADTTNCVWAWNRKSHGLYSRTNAVTGSPRDLTAQFVEPRNGYTYIQGIHVRNADGITYGQLCYYAKSGVATTPNQNNSTTTDSLGLFSDNQRGAEYPGGPFHYMYKRGVYVGGENSGESGMGYGTGPPTWLYLTGYRNFAFLFSTRHMRVMEGTKNSDGTGGQMAGSNADFNYFVEQLQVALARNV
jgi:hypothetical protein